MIELTKSTFECIVYVTKIIEIKVKKKPSCLYTKLYIAIIYAKLSYKLNIVEAIKNDTISQPRSQHCSTIATSTFVNYFGKHYMYVFSKLYALYFLIPRFAW